LHHLVEAGRIPNSNTALMPTRFQHGLCRRYPHAFTSPRLRTHSPPKLEALFLELCFNRFNLRQLKQILDEES
jgi:hypothetical protein